MPVFVSTLQRHDMFGSLVLSPRCGRRAAEGVLFYNIRPSAGPATPLSGARVDEDLPTQAVDDALLGQIDGVEGGEITGWACKRGYMGAPLQARFNC